MAEAHTHERLAPPTVAARRVLLVAAACLVFLAATFALLGFFYFSIVPRQSVPPPQTFPAPRLLPRAAANLVHVETQQRTHIEGYRWANADHTLIAIPIERAMKLIVQRGADAYAPIVAAPAKPAPASGAHP